MKIFEVRVDITRQLKQYESDKVGVSAILEDGDDVCQVIQDCKKICEGQILEVKGTSTTKVDVKQLELPIENKPEIRVKPEAKKAPAPKVEEVKAEEPKKEEPKKVKKEAAPKKPKNITYSRENDLHKKHVGQFLDDKYMTWRKDPKVKAAAVEASKAMEGKEFMNSSGEIIEEFKTSFTETLENALKS